MIGGDKNLEECKTFGTKKFAFLSAGYNDFSQLEIMKIMCLIYFVRVFALLI